MTWRLQSGHKYYFARSNKLKVNEFLTTIINYLECAEKLSAFFLLSYNLKSHTNLTGIQPFDSCHKSIFIQFFFVMG